MNKLFVIGIGPGNYDMLTVAADKAIRSCDVIVGYRIYVDLIREHYADKEFLSSSMTEEVQRCNAALELAKGGTTVGIVCSGDSGIYGMAALVYELRGSAELPEIEIIPGITAACSGAALLGAPLTDDFSAISLSDRLTSWNVIEKRLICAAQSDMMIVLYNPASKGRPKHLQTACDILLRFLPEDRICGLVRNIGRNGEEQKLLSLGQLRDTGVDMFCTVFIGNSKTKALGGKLITPRGYRYV